MSAHRRFRWARHIQRRIQLIVCGFLSVVLATTPVWGYELSGARVSDKTVALMPLAATHSSNRISIDPGPTVRELTVRELTVRGRESYSAQQFSAAVDSWAQALAVLTTQNKPADRALLLSYLTAAYQQLGQWQNAEDSIRQSLDLLSAVAAAPQISAQVYNTFGSLQFATGQTQSALETWQRAAALYFQTGDGPRYFNNLLNQIQAQQALGYTTRCERACARSQKPYPHSLYSSRCADTNGSDKPIASSVIWRHRKPP